MSTLVLQDPYRVVADLADMLNGVSSESLLTVC